MSFRFLLSPFSLLWGLVAEVRGKLFDWGVLPSRAFPLPVICVGNLAVGGTGKTPHVEYLLRLLHRAGYRVAMLSRGYGRRTRGYLLADGGHTAADIGDEPLQVKRNCPFATVAVCERRVEGIGHLLRLPEPPQVVVLDDAYQHRYVRPGFSVLLTAASRPYTADHLLPWGRLRERPHAARRAQAVVVTKCAPGQRPPVPVGPGQSLFYSRIAYLPLQPWSGQQGEESEHGVEGQTLLLLTAIAHPEPLRDHLHLRGAARVESLAFPDHHAFGPRDIERIHSAFARLRPDRVVTTQKDAMRLQAVEPQLRPDFLARLCVQPIGVEIEPAGTSQRTFNQTILQYVESHTANR